MVKRRYHRWIERGVFGRMFAAVSEDPDLEWLSIDATMASPRGRPTD